MTPPRLPGTHVIAALMLTVAIVSAVSITGPIPIRYEVIKDFQPMIAAMVALCAAGLVYYAARLKVNFDRSVHEAAELRRKANLIRKLRYAAFLFFTEVFFVRTRVVPGTGETLRGISQYSFVLRIPKEFDEAWGHMDVFRSEEHSVLVNVRFSFGVLLKEQASLDPAKTWSYRWPMDPPDEIAEAVKAVQELERFLDKLIHLLPSN